MSREDKTNRAAERRNDTACPALESTGGCPAENDLSADSCAECAKADDDL